MKYPDLKSFERRLNACPPRAENRNRRRNLLKTINPIFRRPDLGAKYPPIADYYRRRVDRVLREIQATRVSRGLVVWKLHGSGFIIKTPHTVFAVDVVDCVIKPEADSESLNANDLLLDRDRWNRAPEDIPAPMALTADQRHALAQIVRFAFFTHQHRDHISWDLTRRFVEAGATVVVTPGIRDAFREHAFAEKLVVPDHVDSRTAAPDLLRLGTLGVRTHRGYQVHKRGRTTECNAYLISTDAGVDVLTKGDTTDTTLVPWLARARQFGARVDLYVGYLHPTSDLEQIVRDFDCFLIPGHDWDMVHHPAQPGTRYWTVGPWAGFFDDFDWHFVRNRAEFLTWGEHLRVLPTPPESGHMALAGARTEITGFRLNGIDHFFDPQQTQSPAVPAQWRWRGRTLEIVPPPHGAAFGIFPLDLRSIRTDPVLHLGLAIPVEQPKSSPLVLQVKTSDPGQTTAHLLDQVLINATPQYHQIPLTHCAGKTIHLTFEILAPDPKSTPVAWLLNPTITPA